LTLVSQPCVRRADRGRPERGRGDRSRCTAERPLGRFRHGSGHAGAPAHELRPGEATDTIQFRFVDDPQASVTEAAEVVEVVEVVEQVTAELEAAIAERQRAIQERQQAIQERQWEPAIAGSRAG